MPIHKYLSDPDITAEIARAMAIAYDMVCAELAAQRSTASRAFVAQQIAHYAMLGIHDADELATRVLQVVSHEPHPSPYLARSSKGRQSF
jgi:hypothetical protein